MHLRVCEQCNRFGRVPLIRNSGLQKVCKHCHGTGFIDGIQAAFRQNEAVFSNGFRQNLMNE
ncbi:hypothetical protein [Bacillus xiapuensis]|uniref:hypothetical protein n=1 Tax=Bacillus xiapuensis TaxID=2014075 RepID=UPI000C232D8A|nr:hypothetical protein [Bacillus xiapuensis]